MNFEKLTVNQIGDFLKLARRYSIQLNSNSDIYSQAKYLFDQINKIGGNVTFPVADLYTARHYQGPKNVTYTLKQLLYLSDDDVKAFDEVFKFDRTLSDLDTNRERIIRILDHLDLINYNFNEILDHIIKNNDAETMQRLFQSYEDYRDPEILGMVIPDYFDKIIETGNIDLVKLLASHFEDIWYQTNSNELLDSALTSKDFETIEYVFQRLDEEFNDEEQYLLISSKIISYGDLDLAKRLSPDLYGDLDVYIAAIDSGSIPIFEWVKSLPIVNPENIEHYTEEDINELEENVSYSSLVRYAAEVDSPMLEYLISKDPNSINQGLKGAVSNRHKSNIDLVKDLVGKGANNIWEALTLTSHLVTFDWLIDKGEWNERQLNFLLNKSIDFGDADLVNKIVELGGSDFESALKKSIKNLDGGLSNLLKDFGQISDEKYQEMLNNAFLDMVSSPDFEKMKSLVNRGANNLDEGLILAARLGRLNIMEYLLENGANSFELAYNSAPEEKQTWIRRRFPDLVSSFN